MRIAFLDFTILDYTALTPRERPLGGMQSAACHLAVALAARGHSITLVNRTTTPGRYGGVECVNLKTVRRAAFSEFDAIVSIAAGSTALRRIGVTRPLILWTGHDIDQPAVQLLRDGGERFLWDKIVLVSDWQADRYSSNFKLKRERIAVLRNAIAPSFERQLRDRPYFFASGRPPVLTYCSTPFRGLEILLRAFPLIRKLIPGCEAKIYSSLAVYQTPLAQDEYRALYDLCRATEGVQYIGSVSQDALAEAVAGADVFAYPSIFRETSCIALMEAMASGCMIVSSALGALPETSAGFGRLCEIDKPSDFLETYAQFAAHAIQDAYKNPNQWTTLIEAQREFSLKHYSWSGRAKEWEQLLNTISHAPVRLTAPRRNERCPCGSGTRFKNCCGRSL